MEQVIKQYGKVLLEGMVLVILLMLWFVGIRDDAGNQGVLHVVGARLPTGGINYESYSDFDVCHTESGKQKPMIGYVGGNLTVGVIKLSDYIHATDYAGSDLQIKIMEIRSPDGSDIIGAMADTTEITLDVPGIYTVKLRAIDDGGRKTVCAVEIVVK